MAIFHLLNIADYCFMAAGVAAALFMAFVNGHDEGRAGKGSGPAPAAAPRSRRPGR